ncbi:helix-turn-helix transcriptional regulator [Shewanella nanhaiensis]|uniref:AlpA family transcriptional regulator n=1 Tax=Shewanella nanhaiensis TaxID=2864872 RepID=A0ABS7EAL0_9GAMM|nr:AlpA family transcriptional regulator [Shewanella nanhaiensis]MBW8186196.1 AlpA family transcriptional regulator [Shewanella nanhaiensis]
MSKIILRLPSVKYKTGLSRSSIYLRIAKGEFPESISLGDRAVGWLESDVEQWLDDRIAAAKRANDE